MKYFNFKRYKFSTVTKFTNTIGNKFSELFKSINIKKFFKGIYPIKFNFSKYSKLVNLKTYNLNQLKKINLLDNKFLVLHLPGAIIFFGLLYIVIPFFYNYDKSTIENIICKNKNIECTIKGKVSYNFYPSPRINLKNLEIRDLLKDRNILAKVDSGVIKLSVKNLLAQDKQIYKKMDLKNFEIKLNLKNIKKYKNFLEEGVNFIPIALTKGKILFFDSENYIATIDKANLDLKFIENTAKLLLKGKIFNDKLYVSLNVKKNDERLFTDIIVKMMNLNLLAKSSFSNSVKNDDGISGNVLFKKDKNRLTAIFEYKNNEIIINKSNVKNNFLDGKLDGKITILPYFLFDLDLSLNSINFKKLYGYFLSLQNNKQENLFKISDKINGKLSLSADKVYSSYNLVKSFESRLKFNNANISIEQFLMSLGKLGAADLLGSINNEKKFTNFNFESNIFVENQKKFISKLGIFNKENIPSNLFISGNFDLKNRKISFYEISDDEKLSNNDINIIEKEFNDFMLDEGYNNLFSFPKFKEFIKSITSI